MVTLTGPLVDSTPNVTTLPVLTTHDPSGLRVVYSLQVPNLQPSDVIHIKAQMEVSNNTGYTVSYSWYLLRTNSPTETQNGFYLKEPVYMTFTPNQHHYVTELWAFDSEMPAGTYYYNLIASAKSTTAKPGDTLTVEQTYGDVTALVFSP